MLPEVDLLKPVIFGDYPSGKRRHEVATEIARSNAVDHIGICRHLGRAFPKDPIIALLPRFSRLADAGIAAMKEIAKSLGGESRVSLTEAAASPSAEQVCKELHAAARDWSTSDELQIRHIETAHRFAIAIRSASPTKCFTELLQHHELCGGGLRWFVLRKGYIEPRMPPLSTASGYGFRLLSLCRLATQCGVIRDMPAGLRDDDDDVEEDGEP